MICLFLVLSSILIFISPSFNMFMALLAVYNMSTDNWDPECRNISTRRLCAENLVKEKFDARKEFIYHPFFDGEQLESYIKMDMVVIMPRGNVIIECKSMKTITNKEQFQTFGYLRGTSFPIAILVNFGTWPKAQIERYYYHDDIIWAF